MFKPENATLCIPGLPLAGSLLVWFKKSAMFAVVTLMPVTFFSSKVAKLENPVNQVAGIEPDKPLNDSSFNVVK